MTRDMDEKGGICVLSPPSATLPSSHHFRWTAKGVRLRGCRERPGRQEAAQAWHLREVVRGSGWGWAGQGEEPTL